LKHLFSQICHTASHSKHLYFQHRFMFAVHSSRYC